MGSTCDRGPALCKEFLRIGPDSFAMLLCSIRENWPAAEGAASGQKGMDEVHKLFCSDPKVHRPFVLRALLIEGATCLPLLCSV